MYYNDYNRAPQDQEPIVTHSFRVEEEQPPKRKNRMAVKMTAACLACALVGGLAGGGGMLAVSGLLDKNNTTVYQSERSAPVVSVANTHTDQPMTASEIYARYVGSTVGITTELVTTNNWGQPVSGAAAGSGFVITADGYIVTNYHVVDGAQSIKVAFVDGKTYDATLVGGEEDNDVAVLKIEATGLTPVVIGDSTHTTVGESVVAIGNPLGELTYTLTQGVISAKDRSVTNSDAIKMNMLQTDAAINSGNSGGPLFNAYGEVIGITSAKYSGSSGSSATIEGLGFAIPMNDVWDMIQSIIQNGYVTGKPNMGILLDDVDSQVVQQYGVPAGVYVGAILEGSAADKAGMQVGDIITAVNNSNVSNSDQLKDAVKTFRAGDTTEFVVSRNNQSLTLTVTFDEDNAQRSTDMDALIQEEYEKRQQEQAQQQQQQGGSYYNWPFGFNPFS